MAGATYFLALLQTMLNFTSTIIIFQGERPVFVRERDSGMYDIWIYATTKMIAETPIMLFISALTNVMIYWSVGYNNDITEWLEFYAFIFMVMQAGTAMGYAVSSGFTVQGTATSIAPMVNIPLSILGGYMISLKGIFQRFPTNIIAWATYFSPVRYGFFGMMSAQFPVGEEGSIEYINTTTLLDQYAIDKTTFWTAFFGLLMIVVTMRCLVVLCLRCKERGGDSTGKGDTRNTNIPKPPQVQQKSRMEKITEEVGDTLELE